jgi:hypothetical protein
MSADRPGLLDDRQCARCPRSYSPGALGDRGLCEWCEDEDRRHEIAVRRERARIEESQR